VQSAAVIPGIPFARAHRGESDDEEAPREETNDGIRKFSREELELKIDMDRVGRRRLGSLARDDFWGRPLERAICRRHSMHGAVKAGRRQFHGAETLSQTCEQTVYITKGGARELPI